MNQQRELRAKIGARRVPPVLFFAAMAASAFSLQATQTGTEFRDAFFALAPPLLFPAVMLSGLGTLVKARMSLLILIIAVGSASILFFMNFGGWFGYVSGEPHMWHRGHHMKKSDKEAYVVYFNIRNNGRLPMKLSLDATLNPEETSLVLTAKRYDEAQGRWVDCPIDGILSIQSQSMFPLEIAAGGSLILEMIFTPPGQSAGGVSPAPSAPAGRYSITLYDWVRMRVYHHEIDVPQFSAGHRETAAEEGPILYACAFRTIV